MARRVRSTRRLAPGDAELLFEMALSYRAEAAVVAPRVLRPGEYLGSGDGSIQGPGINGTVRWDLNEVTGDRACQMFFSGVIETDDGAVVGFETLGYGRVTDPATAPNQWAVTASVELTTDDSRYAWLTEQPALLSGAFDAATYRHRYVIVRAARASAGPSA